MRDDFFDDRKGRKGISITLIIVVILLIALLSSTVIYFFMPTYKVNQDSIDAQQKSDESVLNEKNEQSEALSVNETEATFTKLYDENCQVVVVLDGYIKQNGKEIKYSQSSGFIISDDGYILTNHHCVNGIDKLTATLYNGDVYDAEIIGSDERTEVAVIKINAKKKLKTAVLGDSDKVKIGQYAIAIGNPIGFEYSMSIGFVSGLERAVDSQSFRYKMIQVDTPLNSGNSGGPLFNSNGEVIGINTMKSSSYTTIVEGIGFAIPINLAKEISEILIKDGKVTRAAIEATIGTYTGESGGAIIAEVVKDGAADKAGLRSNDIIIKFNDVDIKTINDLVEQLEFYKPNDTVEIVVIRGEKEVKTTLKLGST